MNYYRVGLLTHGRILLFALTSFLVACSEPMSSSSTSGNVNVTIATPVVGVSSSEAPLSGVLLTTAYPFLSAITMEIVAPGHTTASINSNYNGGRFTMVSGADALYISDSNFTLNVPDEVDVSFYLTAYHSNGFQLFTASGQLTSAQLSSGGATLPLAMRVDVDPTLPRRSSLTPGGCADSDVDDLCDIYEDMFVQLDGNEDIDGDGAINRNDTDSDGDGFPDNLDGIGPSNDGYPNFIHANNPPTGVTLTINTALGVEGFGSPLVVDSDEGDCHTFSIGVAPTNGVATIYDRGPVDATDPFSCTRYEVGYLPNNPSYTGADSFTLIAEDRVGPFVQPPEFVSVVVPVTIAGSNTLPVATAQSINTNEDSPITITLSGSDAEGSAIAYTITANPANGNLIGTAPNLNYVPNPNYNGSDSIRFTVSDGVASSAEAVVTITVNPLNDVPTISGTPPVSVNEDSAYSFTPVASDVDVGDTLSFSIVNKPAWATFNSATGQLSGTPVNADVGTSTGIVITVRDSATPAASASLAAFDLTVLNTNDAPTAISGTVTTNEDTPYIVTATDFGFADVDGNTMTQVQITTLEAVGALQLSGLDVILNQVISRTDIDAGNLRYTPVPDGNGTGYDSFGFRVHDGTVYSLNSYSMSVDVTGVNDAPIAVADSDSTAEDFPVTTLNVLLNDTDVDGDLLSVSTADTSSANGALVTNNSNGTFVYNPPLNFNGSDSFGYTVSDGKGGTAVGTVTITVGPINDPPVALDDGGFTQQRASLRSSSVEVAGTSVLPSVNANGRFVTFWSDDPALVANDKNGVFDLYIRDTLNDLTVRATVNSAGVEADTGEKIPALLHTAAISADSRYVLFESRATNLGTQNLGPYYSELYTFDRLGATTTAMLLGCKGGGPNGDSYEADATPDFNTFVFTSLATDPWPACWTITDVNKVSDIYLRRFNTSLYMRVSVDSKGGEANGASFHPSLSDDGLVVAFASSASNLIVGDTNGVDDILLKNVPDGVVTRVSVDSLGKESDGHSWGPSISADGTRIAFVSSATNLVGGDANGVADIFLHDASTGTTRRISVDSLGVEAKGPSDAPHISKDGRFVTFVSQASNLVADDLNGVADLFVHDTVSGQTRRLSLNTLGVEANGASATPRFSGDGRHVVYGSAADNLVSVDKNALDDAFITTMTEITTVAQFSVTTPNLMLNDSDVDSTFAIKGFTQPSNGSVTDNGNATFDYLPNVGVVGIDAFSYTINDGALADTAWVWLASETANFPPNGVADSATTISPNQVTITVLANDFDLDGDKLTVSAADASSINGGKVTLNLDDTITFSPGSLGLDSFTYTVTDGVASSVVAVTVNVQ